MACNILQSYAEQTTANKSEPGAFYLVWRDYFVLSSIHAEYESQYIYINFVYGDIFIQSCVHSLDIEVAYSGL